LKRYPGSCPAFIHLLIPEVSETIIALPDAIKLKADSTLIREVNSVLGYEAVDTICTAASIAPKKQWFQKKEQKKN
jgi:DNA polymerase-3 subunit alpha